MVFDLTGLIHGRSHDLETHVLILSLRLLQMNFQYMEVDVALSD